MLCLLQINTWFDTIYLSFITIITVYYNLLHYHLLPLLQTT